MASEDELRASLAEVAAREDHARARDSGSTRDHEWDDMTKSDQRSWMDYELIDALLPVVVEALAEAWDDGAELGYEWQLGVIPKPANPWRRP